jgi:hypothetical protein
MCPQDAEDIEDRVLILSRPYSTFPYPVAGTKHENSEYEPQHLRLCEFRFLFLFTYEITILSVYYVQELKINICRAVVLLIG